jgi:hypothetical protein
MCGTFNSHGQNNELILIWLGKPVGRRLCGRRRHSWEEDIKMICKKECLKVPGDRLSWWVVANMVINLGGS